MDEQLRRIMYLHTQQLINEIVVDEPDPAAANALQEGLGGSSVKCGP
jgi:Mn-containing catalase